MGGVLLGLLVQVGFGPPPFPSPSRRRRERGEKRRKEGGAAPPLIQFGLGKGDATSGRPSHFSTKAHCGPLIPWGVPVTPQYSGKCPNLSETIPVSKHNLQIYQYLPPDHFKTPRHVRDLSRDSEQHSVTKSYNTMSSTNGKRADPTGSRTM